jgi:hypothetical protein
MSRRTRGLHLSGLYQPSSRMALVARILLIIVSVGCCNVVRGAPTDNDTAAEKSGVRVYKVPKSSMFYLGAWYGFMKPTLVIGAIQVQDSCFRFVPLDGLPGWPEEMFERKYPFNSGFKPISISYKDVNSIRYSGRIKLKNGGEHQMFGIRRRYWRPLYKQIKANVRATSRQQ